MGIDKILGCAIAVLVAIIIGLLLYISTLHETIRADKIEISNLKMANTALKSSIDNQNKAIEDIRKHDLILAKKAAAEMAKAQSVAEKHRKNAETIKNQIVTGDECQNANTLLSEYIKGVGL